MNLAGRLAPYVLLAATGLAFCDLRVAEAQASKPELAVRRGREGVTLYESGQWSEALTAFREADALFHSPVLTLYVARSLRSLGRLVEARRVYETLAREVLDPDAPRTWSQAQRDGGAELEALDREVPRIVVDVGAAPGATASVDGVAVRPGETIALDPGRHQVEWTSPSGRVSKEVTLRRGSGTTRVELREPVALGASGTDGFTVLGIVLSGVGGAALATGGVFGILALNDASSAGAALPSSCSADRACLPKERDAIERTYDSAYVEATVADALFLSGGIAAAAGIALLIIDPGHRSVRPNATSHRGGLRVSF